MAMWDYLSGPEKAAMLRSICLTLTSGDDLNIHISNASREVIGDSAENDRLVTDVLEAAALAAEKVFR